MISLEGLVKYVDASQIPREFGGALHFDHEEWLELRVDVERLVWRVSDHLRSLENFAADMAGAEMPVNVVTAEEAIAEHTTLHSLIFSISLEAIEADLQQVRARNFVQRKHHHQLYKKRQHYVENTDFQLKKRIFSDKGSYFSTNGTVHSTSANPDLVWRRRTKSIRPFYYFQASIFPHLLQLIKSLAKAKSDVTSKWELRKQVGGGRHETLENIIIAFRS